MPTSPGNAAETIYLKNHSASIPSSNSEADQHEFIEKTRIPTINPQSLTGSAAISGTVYESDGVTPITEETVWIIAIQNDPCGSNNIASTYTDYNLGSYKLTGLPAGTYYLPISHSRMPSPELENEVKVLPKIVEGQLVPEWELSDK